MAAAAGNIGEIDDDETEWWYCGCHGTAFHIDDGICPSCNDEWTALEPDDDRYPSQEERDAR